MEEFIVFDILIIHHLFILRTAVFYGFPFPSILHARTEDLGRDCFSQGPKDFRPLPVFGRERTSITQLFDVHVLDFKELRKLPKFCVLNS